MAISDDKLIKTLIMHIFVKIILINNSPKINFLYTYALNVTLFDLKADETIFIKYLHNLEITTWYRMRIGLTKLI